MLISWNPVVNARDGMEALEILRGRHTKRAIKPPFLILLDLNMPRMGGLEFLQELRADSDLVTTDVYVITTSNNKRDQAAAESFGVLGYFVKRDFGDDYQQVISLIDRHPDIHSG